MFLALFSPNMHELGLTNNSFDLHPVKINRWGCNVRDKRISGSELVAGSLCGGIVCRVFIGKI
jgi:hypothetical protein